MSESLALASTFSHPSEQADASKHEGAWGAGTDEKDRQNKKIL